MHTDHVATFSAIVAAQIANFPGAKAIRRIEEGTATVEHYRSILTTIFHQTYSAPYTFARAAANCPWRHEAAKEYLITHAEEEKTHWRWVIDDLKSIGYSGADIRTLPPHITCQAYIGLNYFVAEEHPVARLAIASVLEGIAATFGGQYGKRFLQQAGLSPKNATFFLSHGETDKGHIVDLAKLIERLELSPEEWAWMNHSAEMAGLYYRAMYDHSSFA